jgi:hypothetical protein
VVEFMYRLRAETAATVVSSLMAMCVPETMEEQDPMADIRDRLGLLPPVPRPGLPAVAVR